MTNLYVTNLWNVEFSWYRRIPLHHKMLSKHWCLRYMTAAPFPCLCSCYSRQRAGFRDHKVFNLWLITSAWAAWADRLHKQLPPFLKDWKTTCIVETFRHLQEKMKWNLTGQFHTKEALLFFVPAFVEAVSFPIADLAVAISPSAELQAQPLLIACFCGALAGACGAITSHPIDTIFALRTTGRVFLMSQVYRLVEVLEGKGKLNSSRAEDNAVDFPCQPLLVGDVIQERSVYFLACVEVTRGFQLSRKLRRTNMSHKSRAVSTSGCIR